VTRLAEQDESRIANPIDKWIEVFRAGQWKRE
jgi:hypothetical protein